MVAVSDFSGLVSSACALASAEARAAIDSLDRCMGRLHVEQIEANGPDLRSPRPQPMADCLLGVLRKQGLELGLSALVFEIGRPGGAEERREFCPAVGRAHID